MKARIVAAIISVFTYPACAGEVLFDTPLSAPSIAGICANDSLRKQFSWYAREASGRTILFWYSNKHMFILAAKEEPTGIRIRVSRRLDQEDSDRHESFEGLIDDAVLTEFFALWRRWGELTHVDSDRGDGSEGYFAVFDRQGSNHIEGRVVTNGEESYSCKMNSLVLMLVGVAGTIENVRTGKLDSLFEGHPGEPGRILESQKSEFRRSVREMAMILENRQGKEAGQTN